MEGGSFGPVAMASRLAQYLHPFTREQLASSSTVKRQGIWKEAIESVAMISVIAQERLLGAALGSILTGIIVFEERKRIYRSVSDDQPHCATASLMKEPIFGKMTRAEIAHLWNRTVDKTLGPVIESLSSRGCSVKKEESLKGEHLKYLAEIERGKIPTARNTARARPTAMPAILPCWTALDRDSESLLDRASTAPTWAAIGSGEQLEVESPCGPFEVIFCVFG
ncbi:hypothetical protein SAY86_026301 [Trapa natans]|uniref:Uncharacterized protein n=1 Tax=Trapa natans TaxID=22666 RepID=A0AAN7QEE1_TRANT|nr:hypothetical protein SAY86_026301 [Trapa natans]